MGHSARIKPPRADDRAFADKLLKSWMPPARLYAKYADSAHQYKHLSENCGIRPSVRFAGGSRIPMRLSWRRSVLSGRRYLIAWLDGPETNVKGHPSMNAVTGAVPLSWTRDPLPLIFVPGTRRSSRSRLVASFVEHEIVHANQMILGRQIPELKAESSSHLIKCFFEHAHLEYDAHFIQLARWRLQQRFAQAMPFDRFVLLRAYTDSLEQTLRQVALGATPPTIVSSVLAGIRDQAPRYLSRMGCRVELIEWFQARWPQDVAIALQGLKEEGVAREGSSLRVVEEWVVTALSFG